MKKWKKEIMKKKYVKKIKIFLLKMEIKKNKRKL